MGWVDVPISVFAGGPGYRKQMVINRIGYNWGAASIALDAYWTYYNEGRPLTVTYPVVTDPSTGNPTNTSYTYSYDTMGRPSTMTNSIGAYTANSVTYNANDQMTYIGYGDGVYGTNETRNYNSMYQLTNLSTSFVANGSSGSFRRAITFRGHRIMGRS
jgi:YD repeat-containing protein